MQENNVNATLSTSGLFWDYNQNSTLHDPGYEIPLGSGLSTIYTGSFWIGGLDPNGALHQAAGMYNDMGHDYWPGPIDETTLSAYNCFGNDRIWSISKVEIDAFLTTGTTSQNILDWPGKNNPNLLTIPANQNLAPFVDANNDGDYNPADGDYPAIKGDFANWWVINDVGNTHGTYGIPLGVEIHTMAYGFTTNDDINNTTFYDMEIVNKSDTSYSETYMGIFVDPDIGGEEDDYVGCDTIWNLGYAYNGDDYDDTSSLSNHPGYGDNPPIQGVTMLKLPTLDGIEANMTSFASFDRLAPISMGDPTFPTEYYNYMKGFWLDGSNMVYGGNGHISGGGTQPFPYQFSGLPSDTTQWSECSSNNTPGDRRFVISFGKFYFHPNRTIKLTFACVYHRPTSGTHCDGIEGLLEVTENVHNFYNSLPAYYNNIDNHQSSNISISPNPANDWLYLTDLPTNCEVSIFDVSGKRIMKTRSYSNSLSLSTKEIPSGMYYVKLDSKNLKHTHKLVVEH